jgi:hypothetical protein
MERIPSLSKGIVRGPRTGACRERKYEVKVGGKVDVRAKPRAISTRKIRKRTEGLTSQKRYYE